MHVLHKTHAKIYIPNR